MTTEENKIHPSIISALSCYLHIDLIPEDSGPEWIAEQGGGIATQLTNSGADLPLVHEDLKRLAEGKDESLLYQTENATFCWVDEPEYFDVFIGIFKEMLSAVEYRIEWNRNNAKS